MPELGQVNRAVKELHDEGVMKGSVLLLLLLLVPSPSPSKRRAGQVRFEHSKYGSVLTGVKSTDSHLCSRIQKLRTDRYLLGLGYLHVPLIIRTKFTTCTNQS